MKKLWLLVLILAGIFAVTQAVHAKAKKSKKSKAKKEAKGMVK